MPLVINTNISVLAEERKVFATAKKGSGLATLTAGARGTAERDRPENRLEAERLRAEVRSLANRQRGATEGVSALQVAHGALGHVEQSLLRMRDIAREVAEGDVSSGDLAELEREFDELASQIDSAAGEAEYGGQKLFDGGAVPLPFQVELQESAEASALPLPVIGADALPSDGRKVSQQRLGEPASAKEALGTVEAALREVAGLRGQIGTAQDRLRETINGLATQRENLSASTSRIADVDAAAETIVRTRELIAAHSEEAILAQSGQLSSLATRLL